MIELIICLSAFAQIDLYKSVTVFVRKQKLPVQKQPNGHNCGPFAIIYAAENLDGHSPSEAVFDVNKMREHLITCLKMQRLTPFRKVSNQ